MIDVIKSDQDKIAIVVVGYNRISGLKRLLDSINEAYYSILDIPLVISIDCSGNESLYSFVREYQWNHGTKYVNIENNRLGLKKHVLQCGDLTQVFKGVILLEDDIYVSPMFYEYTINAFNKYGNDPNIAAISLYSYENIFLKNYIPFQPLYKGDDVYASQIVSSWGQAWNTRMWHNFKTWLNQWDEDFSKVDIPTQVKSWERAWTKYFYAYMQFSNTYYLFPYFSYSTNFNDCGGEHGGSSDGLVQSSLAQGGTSFRFPDFKDLIKYDVYYQNTLIEECLNVKGQRVLVDLYALRQYKEGEFCYLLTTAKMPYRIVQQWGLNLRPIELNIIKNVSGKGIYLYDLSEKGKGNKVDRMTYEFLSYSLHGYLYKFLAKYLLIYIKRRIQCKLNK